MQLQNIKNQSKRRFWRRLLICLLIPLINIIFAIAKNDDKRKPELITQAGHIGSVRSVTFSPDGKTIASSGSGETIKIWDAATGQEIRTFQEDKTIFSSVRFSPDGKILAAGSNKNIKFWDVVTGKEIKIIQETKWVDSITYSPDGKMIVSGSSGAFDYTVKLWDAVTGKEIRTLKGHTKSVQSVAFSLDGKMIASGSEDKTVKLWSTKTGQLIKSLDSHIHNVMSVAFSPDGKTLASGSMDMTIKFWNVKTGKEIKSFAGHTSFVESVTFSPNGKILASGSQDNSIKLWNPKTGELIRSFEGQCYLCNSVAFSPDGKTLVSGGGNTLKIWNVETGQEIKNLTGNATIILFGMFSSNGKTLVWASNDGIARFWDIETGKLLEKFYFLDGKIRKVLSIVPDFIRNPTRSKISPDGRFQFKTEESYKLNLYEVNSGELLATLIFFGNNDWLVTTSEGIFDGTPHAWKNLIWRFDNNTFSYAPVEAFFKEFYRPGLLQDILAGNKIEPPTQDLSKIDIRQPLVKISAVDGKAVDSSALLPDSVSADKKSIKIKVEITDNISEPRPGILKTTSSDANDVRLFRNGSLVKLWSDNAFNLTEKDGCKQIAATKVSARKAVCETEIQITTGKNELTVYGFNRENVKSSDHTAIVNGAESLKQAGTLYVLAVGVNKYANADYNLNYAVKDVVEIGKTFQDSQAKLGNLKQYAKTEIIKLIDNAATKENILNALARLANGDKTVLPENASDALKAEFAKIKQTQPEDAVVIYFAGHGVSKGQRFYLLPHNFTGDANLLEKQSVSDLELNQYLEKVDAGKLLMVIDACQSGQALGGKNDGRAPMNSKGFAQLAYDKGMYILTAAQSYQAALEAVKIGDKTIENGLLTYSLLQAFSDKTADKDENKQLWEREWFDFAVNQVPLFQREAMKQREVDLNKNPQTKDRSGIYYVNGDEKKKAEERNVQTPRVFYRREMEIKPFILANP